MEIYLERIRDLLHRESEVNRIQAFSMLTDPREFSPER